jgi:flagellar biosynthesis chaperone FliJ
MAVSRALSRLLRIRELEEEQSRLVLELALSELNRLENALRATVERERRGRSLVGASARTNQLPDRLAGLEETRSSVRHAAALGPRIEATGDDVAALRREFLGKRIERRQAETLIQETEAEDAIAAGRRGQQALDDWYGSRLYREASEAESVTTASPESVSPSPAASASVTGQSEYTRAKT